MSNPLLGVSFHWLGGLAAGSFYIPYKGVRRWAWEIYWLAGGIFSWVVAPLVVATILVPDWPAILQETPSSSVYWAYLFGVLWGVGGLTFGLSMRYLGIALGYAVALGYCAAFGELMVPLYQGKFGTLLHTTPGQVVLLGVAVCLAGIALSGLAGRAKERELSASQKQATIAEFHFTKGILVATVAGILSACMNFGLTAGQDITEFTQLHLDQRHQTGPWQGLPTLIVVLAGGFTTNTLWCLALALRNHTLGQFVGASTEGAPPAASSPDAAADRSGAVATLAAPARTAPAPLLLNYALCAVAGVTWYFQFFFYTIGAKYLGSLGFSSWTLHMASIIIFSTLWGIALREWRGASRRTHALIAAGLAVLMASTVIIGYGNYLKSPPTP